MMGWICWKPFLFGRYDPSIKNISGREHFPAADIFTRLSKKSIFRAGVGAPLASPGGEAIAALQCFLTRRGRVKTLPYNSHLR